VDQDHPGGQEGGEEDVEVKGAGIDAVEKGGEGDGAEKDDGQEGGAVVVVEAVTGFEAGGREARFGGARFEKRGVQKAGV
jgi:hypothetical protein